MPITLAISPESFGEVRDLLSALEHSPDCVLQRLSDCIGSLLSGISDSDLTLAPIAGKDVFRLEFPVGLVSELRAAAVCADQVDSLCAHGGPHAK